MLSRIHFYLRYALNLLLPPRCVATGEIVEAQGLISAQSWVEIDFISDPCCAQCGLPFPYDVGAEALCGACLEDPPLFSKARAAVVYNDSSRKLILRFKHGDRLQSVDTFATWMIRAGADIIHTADVIVPVPLHRSRLWRRRYNQSALLAQAIGKRRGIACCVDALARTRPTPPQKGLGRRGRKENVRKAFQIRRPQDVKDKCVLLIDDVFTSGATLNECARVLKSAGAKDVIVLALARVTRDHDF